jgi:Ca2+:H+ antiporter
VRAFLQESRGLAFRGWLGWMLLLVPAAIALKLAHQPPVVQFLAAAAAVIPLAGLLGRATEEVAARMGPTAGGLLNGTLGNAGELIIALLALRAGHIEVVQASLSGSIIGNLLLVFGLAAFVGGLNREKQTYSRVAAGTNVTMLFLAVVALVAPAIFNLVAFGELEHKGDSVEKLALGTSIVLVAIYLTSFIMAFRTHRAWFQGEPHGEPTVRQSTALALLVAATVLIVAVSEILVGAIEEASRTLGLTELFVGMIVVAVVGNAAEHSTAILMARKNQPDAALAIAVGSSTQIALLVAPVLVFTSFLLGNPMTLVFHPLEIAAVVFSVLIIHMVAVDGETNWFEGLELLAVYVMLALAFYYLPART